MKRDSSRQPEKIFYTLVLEKTTITQCDCPPAKTTYVAPLPVTTQVPMITLSDGTKIPAYSWSSPSESTKATVQPDKYYSVNAGSFTKDGKTYFYAAY